MLFEQTHDDRLTCLLPWFSRLISVGSGLRLFLSPRHVALSEEWQL